MNNTDWRLSTFNGALLASFFIPSWTIAAIKIYIAPVRGLYDRANIAPAMFVSDYLNLTALQTIRFAWLLALGKLTVVAFFAVFLIMIVRNSIHRKGSCDEPLSIALLLGAAISMASMIAANQVGELEALRLHASETLLLIGASIILIIDSTPAKSEIASSLESRSSAAAYPHGSHRS